MRTKLVAFAMVVAIMMIMVPFAQAITFGEPDGNGHPNVGILVIELEGEKVPICSGSLISPTVFLTAGHCTADLPSLGISEVEVSFDSEFDPDSSTLFPGTYQTHPDFDPSTLFNDLAVVLLSRKVQRITPVSLPPAGLLDQMQGAGILKGQQFTNVGYGVVPSFKGAPPQFSFDGVRRVSTSPFGGLTEHWLRLLMNNDATGQGGSCFGDSGSPKFLGTSNTIVAVTSWGDAICRSQNMNYRLDIPSAREFLSQFVTLP